MITRHGAEFGLELQIPPPLDGFDDAGDSGVTIETLAASPTFPPFDLYLLSQLLRNLKHEDLSALSRMLHHPTTNVQQTLGTLLLLLRCEWLLR